MSGQACLVIIRGNKTQANARSLATEQIVEAMTPAQMDAAVAGLRAVAEDLADIARIKITWQQHATNQPEANLLSASRFAIAAAATVCDLTYEFLPDAMQQQASDRMQSFNDGSDALLEQILLNPA